MNVNKILLSSYLLIAWITITAQSDVELLPSGITIPRTNHTLISNPSKGQLTYSVLTGGLMIYDGEQWNKVGNESDQMIDDDNDTKVFLYEGNPDYVEFKVNGIKSHRIYTDTLNVSSVIWPTSPYNNTYFGKESWGNAIEEKFREGNSSFGARAGMNNEGSNNSFFGWGAGQELKLGHENTFIGAASGATATTGDRNTLIGYWAGITDTFMNDNVMIGYYSGIPKNSFQFKQRSGNIFIGTYAGGVENNNDRLYIENSEADSSEALIYGKFDENEITFNHKVGISVTEPEEALDVNGSARFRSVGNDGSAHDLRITSDGTLTTNTSDFRLKMDIQPIENALEKIGQIRGVSFLWKNDPKAGRQQGVIAQEVLNVAPELVFERDGYYGVDNSEMVGLLIEAIKELKIENDKLSKRIIMLEKSKRAPN